MAKSKAKIFKEKLDKVFEKFRQVENDYIQRNRAEISITELKVIRFIGSSERCIMREISERLYIPKNNVTAIIDKLAEKRIVTRVRSGKDRRLVYVELTEKGENLFEKELKSSLDVSRELLKALNKKERDKLFELLEKITKEE